MVMGKSILLAVLSVSAMVLMQRGSCSILDRYACLSSFDGQKFGTDSDVISCVGGPSKTCCNALDAYMGSVSPFANCSCSDEIMTQVIKDSVPKFAVELMEKRIAECGNVALSGSTFCNETDEAHAYAMMQCGDVTPPYHRYSCEQEKEWGKCNEGWMVSGAYCAMTCGRCDREVQTRSDEDGE
eukprot:CAMPEP_0182607168 /NCGR_PEP_ID=MMETSP1330-20130603/1910_1 /TAXON_ID=464278 /ORGANISM="Picochlorum sp., Strain RCC944" /LENGTH=183 /DNA_ID=CAMNT_0024825709 /DNA_START=137 /DNA_END=688 /DNA_ORIENTATION=-